MIKNSFKEYKYGILNLFPLRMNAGKI